MVPNRSEGGLHFGRPRAAPLHGWGHAPAFRREAGSGATPLHTGRGRSGTFSPPPGSPEGKEMTMPDLLSGIYGEILSFIIVLLPPVILLWMHNRKAKKGSGDSAPAQPQDS